MHVYAVHKNSRNTGWREREREKTNRMQLIWYLLFNFILNMFRSSLCPSSGEQYRVLLHVVFCTVCAGCGCMGLGCGLCAPYESYCSYSNCRTVHTARVPAAHNQCRTPHAVVHGLGLLMMGKMMPETCWDRRGIINIKLVTSFSIFSLFSLCSWFTVTRA